jgi:hypothetical protein
MPGSGGGGRYGHDDRHAFSSSSWVVNEDYYHNDDNNDTIDLDAMEEGIGVVVVNDDEIMDGTFLGHDQPQQHQPQQQQQQHQQERLHDESRDDDNDNDKNIESYTPLHRGAFQSCTSNDRSSTTRRATAATL